MIKSWKHKGLQSFFETGSTKGIRTEHSKKLRIRLSVLDEIQCVTELQNWPNFELHPLIGDRKGFWSISVSGNWRITFEFIDGNAYIVNYEDYH